ncbi:hypothetical protein [Flavobacterium selenitireducens]|uniref:hypothetical protein n=1 Tax=Flavobacterium selenitireducens TaxID=2722704 RepID=UPI00168BD5AA|nr:hypothetical protein [Flavobacterium selenitireducens]
MTIKSSIFTALVLALATTSCKKELEPQESSVAAAETAAATPATPLAATAATPQQPMQVQPQQTQVQMQQPQAQATAPGMNPPHGQPGHRCDIAVGAPLNQPVKSASAPAPTSPTTITKITPSTPVPTSNKTAPGMNPPHGQQGHRCDIAVGTPLSQPVKTTSVQTANSANGQPITVTPGVISSDGKVTPGSGVKVTTTNAPVLLQDPNNKPAESK